MGTEPPARAARAGRVISAMVSQSAARVRRYNTGAMPLASTSDLWWKDAVVYCMDIETFRDSDGDGVGDVGGLIEGVDHVDALGVLFPLLKTLYPSPNSDEEYVITNHPTAAPRHRQLAAAL